MGDLTKLTTKTQNMTAQDSVTTTLTDTTKNDLDVELVSDELYPWANDNNEKRRAFVFEYFNWNPDIHVDAQMQQLDRINKWLSGR